MPAKKTATTKKKAPPTGFQTISWLKFLPNLSLKRYIIFIITITMVCYGSFISIRIANDFICFDWPWTNTNQHKVNALVMQVPEKWQRYYCIDNSITLKDKYISNWSKLSLAMGWGGYEYFMSPGEAGNIEINSGSRQMPLYKGKSLEEVFTQRSTQDLPNWERQEFDVLKIDGMDAKHSVTFYDPDPREKQRNWRYQYYNTVFFYDDENWYEIRLWGDWYKQESRDAWVAKYEPVFVELISTAEIN